MGHHYRMIWEKRSAHEVMKNLTQSVCSRYKNEITHVSELEKRLSKFESKLQDVLAKLERLKGVESELVHEKASFEQSLKKL